MIANILNECIDRLAAGQTIEDCLRAYPQYADELAPMLAAGQLAHRAQPDPFEVEQAQASQRFRFEQTLRGLPIRARYPWQRIAALAASFMLVLGIVLSAWLAQDSLPGDSLYSLKRLIEDIRLIFAVDDTDLEQQFAQRRLDETDELLALGREAQVEFEGEVERISLEDNQIKVEELSIIVEQTVFDLQHLPLHSRVEIKARTTRRQELIAIQIRVIQRPTQAPSTSTPTTERPSTAIQTPQPTSTQISRPTATSTERRVPTPTATPPDRSIAPTERPNPTNDQSPTDTPRRGGRP